jgi:endonuclease/exonuclease/phosphatase family metal-dependent hydrolase
MRVRVLTLNTWNLPFRLARHAPLRLSAIGEAIADLDADVVAFQEVWTASGRARLLLAGARAGYRHTWHRPRALGGSGLLVLSRWPIRDAKFLPYRPAGLPQRVQHADYYGGKGLVLLTLDPDEAGKVPFALAATHLHADYVPPDAHDEYLGTRTAQIVQLAHALLPVELPLIAAGDWNTQEGDDEYEVLIGLSRAQDVAAALDARQDTMIEGHPYHGASSRGQRIDMILSRDGRSRRAHPVSIRRVLDEPLRFGRDEGRYSDHAGLLAEIEIEERNASDAGTATPLHPPEAAAIEIAEEHLERGIAETTTRRKRHRRIATAGLGLGALGLATGFGPSAEHSAAVGALLLAFSCTALALGLGSGWLAERFAPDELAGFQEAREGLQALRAAARPGAKVAPR